MDVTLADGDSQGGSGVSVDGDTVTITTAGTYHVSGTLTSGSLVVDAPDGVVDLVLDGVDNEAAYLGVTGGHFGMSTLWTGLPIPPGTVREEGVGWPQGPSVDRLIAAANSTGVSFDAFYWGTWPATYASGQNQGPNGIA